MNAGIQQPEIDTFDAHADDYTAALEQGIAVSGENKEFFAENRIRFLAKCVDLPVRHVLDFGCGIGTATPFLRSLLSADSIVGVDTSRKSIETARKLHGSQSAFRTLADYAPNGDRELAYCNGVFHHIPIDERAGAIDYVKRCLEPNGVFAIWENNAWNPGTRYVMSRIPFDQDAITLTAAQTRQLLIAGGFHILRTDYCFIFPGRLSFLRPIESCLTKLPIGAQYQVLARKISD